MRKSPRLLFTCLFSVILFGLIQTPVRADLVDDLKSKIEERNKVIADLEQEIAEYQVEVEKTGAQAKTLKSKIVALELTRKKLSAEISVIQNKITAANLTIQKLDSEITGSERSIQRALNSIGSTLRQTDMEESNSLAETLLNYPRISLFLDRLESLRELNLSLNTSLADIRRLKQELEVKNKAAQGKRKELISLAGDLSDKKKVAESNKAKTNKLFTETKNTEAAYQKILNQKIALRKAFEQELLENESKLQFAIDPNSLPKTGSGVLNWPIDAVKITQYFGNTAFARANPQIYNGKGHPGVDFRAAQGTKVKAALSGVVEGTGNTDLQAGCYSYGKWVLIKHGNGLSTLYAHLSVIKVVAGQNIATGDTVGYSGETGYAEGPHLHFGVYASQGVKIVKFGDVRAKTNCSNVYMPVAGLNAYLNPLSYL